MTSREYKLRWVYQQHNNIDRLDDMHTHKHTNRITMAKCNGITLSHNNVIKITKNLCYNVRFKRIFFALPRLITMTTKAKKEELDSRIQYDLFWIFVIFFRFLLTLALMPKNILICSDSGRRISTAIRTHLSPMHLYKHLFRFVIRCLHDKWLGVTLNTKNHSYSGSFGLHNEQHWANEERENEIECAVLR